MKIFILSLWPVLLGVCDATLLEMSQLLWSRLLNGGLSNIGALDPLRIPVIKVDQSQGHMNYRIVLRDVEITGLNESTVEGIYTGRGSFKSNASEHDAGYVSYSNRGKIDAVRYRLRMITKDSKRPQSEELKVTPIEGGDVDDKYNQREQSPTDYNQRDQPQLVYYEQGNQRFYPLPVTNPSYRGQNGQATDERPSASSQPQYLFTRTPNYRPATYASTQMPFGYQVTPQNAQVAASPSQLHSQAVRYPGIYRNTYNVQASQKENVHTIYITSPTKVSDSDKSVDSPETAATENRPKFEQLNYGYGNANADNYNQNNQNPSNGEKGHQHHHHDHHDHQQHQHPQHSERLEDQPGYVDIVYVDRSRPGEVKHFGNLRIENEKDRNVYNLENALKDLASNKKFIIHNFTDGESLMKKNDAVRVAQETKRIKNMIRYAKDYQEQEGYYEEGMALIYHFGKANGTVSTVLENKRSKRAHQEENDDDIIHVNVRINVPVLRITAGYVLMGKVGEQVLHGDGRLDGNFTKVIGDFTLELKKSGDNSMLVRAARAKLETHGRSIRLEGINKKGPVEEILTQGLMVAEAVAAMLADDLATKALSEKTSDAIIYKLYNEAPM